ncbi:hypothetical protein [Halobacterium sp. R2-5]|uniref:hypothetical protein n=1 Tax=Halobacterium sp. R2-5 TaxID=2715751 RepID=UPI00141DD869|nr:hypothetical protein [Halobacterium sp. R2-5]NIB98043.1 hypothetical protein [Halobacterium sp. R2-5]
MTNLEPWRIFDDEQEVTSKSWYLPKDTIKSLRSYVIGRYGTTQHIGTVCTRAMTSWMADDPDDPAHRTWERLKTDYDWEDADENVSAWNYRQYVDYTTLSKNEKRALGFSAPKTVIEEFTDDLNKNEYGVTLANAVEAEIRKHTQIRRMHDIIDAGDVDRSYDETDARVDKVEVTEDGDLADWSTITMTDSDIEISQTEIIQFVSETEEVDWETRRGLLAALVRTHGEITRESLYRNDEALFGIEKTRRKRKDKDAIIEHAETAAGPLAIAPAKIVADEMGEHNLPQASGLTNRNQPLNFEDDELDDLKLLLYHQGKHSQAEMWARMVAKVTSIGHDLASVDWTHSDSVTAIYRGKHLLDAINRYLPLVTITADTVEDADVESEHHVSKLNRIRTVLETTRDDISSPGGQDIEDAYERAVEQGKTPQSIEFRRGEETPSTLEF